MTARQRHLLSLPSPLRLLVALTVLVAAIASGSTVAAAETGVAAQHVETVAAVGTDIDIGPGHVGSDTVLFDDFVSGCCVAPQTTSWLRGTAGNAGRVPDSVRTTLDGQTFTSRANFRAAFWRAAGDDPALASQFSSSNVSLMQSGRAPLAPSSQHFGGRTRYELHHVTPVSRGGAEFDLNNIVVVTPRYHQEVLSPSYHYGGGG